MIKIKHKIYKGLLHTKSYMVEVDPNIFFKYTSIDKYTIPNLENQELYFSHPSEFNDPFDSKYNLIYKGERDDWVHFLRKNGKGNPIEINHTIENQIKKGVLKNKKGNILFNHQKKGLRIFNDNMQSINDEESLRACCFSKDKDNILMWSHYANEHKGICLCFKSKQIDKGNFLVLDSDQHPLFPVKYDVNLPKQVNMLSNYNPKDLMDFVCTKYCDWKYEKEYRLILFFKNFDGKFTKNFRKQDLEGIIFGLNTPIEDIENIYDTIKTNYLQEGIRVNFYRAQAIKGKYAINVKKIDRLDKYIQEYYK